MNLKHATLIAIIGVSILTLTCASYIYVNANAYEFAWLYTYLNIANLIGFALLLPYFITFYLNKKNIQIEKNSSDSPVIEKTENQENSTTDKKRYPALRTISVVYKVLAWVAALAGIVGAINVFANNNSDFAALIALGYIIGGLFVALIFAAISEGIKLFIDIEHNTRTKQN